MPLLQASLRDNPAAKLGNCAGAQALETREEAKPEMKTHASKDAASTGCSQPAGGAKAHEQLSQPTGPSLISMLNTHTIPRLFKSIVCITQATRLPANRTKYNKLQSRAAKVGPSVTGTRAPTDFYQGHRRKL